ncbi:MAG: CBS domain-containing protein [Elusimicrobiota bacterium]
MLAKEIMRRKIVAVDRRLTLQELAKVLQANGITGAPVVDGNGTVVGVVSQTDFVRSQGNPAAGIPPYHREADGAPLSLGIHFDGNDQTVVEQIMTQGAISFHEDTPVERLADAMLERHIHRVLITRGEKLVGIVTTMDLLGALVALSRESTPPRKEARRR